MRYKLWDVINECWYDRGDIYLDEDGHLFCIEEITRGYETYMNKENVNARYELLRCTSLKDLNGKEVYHKDIVSYEGDKYLIEWDEERTGFFLAYSRRLNDLKHEDHIMGSYISDCEVMGNLFENPELLEATP